MFLKRMTIHAFGCLKSSAFNFSNTINLIYGGNETGKTTLVAAISQLLMGFSPAKGDSHPYLSWNEGLISLEGTLVSADSEWIVQRRLKSSPSGLFISESKSEKIVNQPSPLTSFISKEIYCSVFTLKAEQLNGDLLKSKSWEDIKAHFLFNLTQNTITSPTLVLKRMEVERKSLYQQHNRGNQRIRQLGVEIQNIKRQLKSEQGAYERYEQKIMELERLEERQSAIAVLKRESQSRINALEKLISSLLAEEDLENQLAQLPPTLKYEAHLSAIELNKVRQQVLDKTQYLNDQVEADLMEKATLLKSTQQITVMDELLLASEDQVRRAMDSVGRQEALALKIEQLESLLLRNHQEMSLYYSEVLKKTYDSTWDVDLKRLNIDEIARLLFERQQQSEPRFDYNSQPSRSLMGGLILSLLLSAAALIGYFTFSKQFWQMLLFIINSSFVIIFAYGYIKMNKHKQEANSAAKEEQDYQSAIERYNNEILKTLSPLLKSVDEVMRLGESSIQGLIQLKHRAIDKESLLMQLEDLKFKSAQDEKAVAAIEATLQFSVSDAYQRLVHLKTLSQEIELASEKANYINARLQSAEEVLHQLNEKKSELENTIESITHIPFSLWYANCETYTAKFIHWHGLKMAYEAKYEKLRHSLDASVELTSLIEEKSNLMVLIQQLEEESIENYGELKAIETECKHLQSVEQYDVLKSKLHGLELELEGAKTQHAHLSVLIELLHATDDVYKALYQPEYLTKASHYFKCITHGRYSEIALSDEDAVWLTREGQVIPVQSMETLSSGTLNQLYFSLYLALIDLLDPQAVLPLFLDDVFVHWDEQRFSEGMSVVSQISKDRQIFLLSCNAHYTQKCEERLGVKRIILTT